MLKKMLVVAAILLMAGTVFGGWKTKFTDPVDANHPATYDRMVDWEYNSDNSNITQRKGEVWAWPASYDFVDIGVIKVRMEVGFWIKLDCKDHEKLTLKQKSITEYGGKTTCKIQANVATVWEAKFHLDSGIKLGGDPKKDAGVTPSSFNATGTKKEDLTIWAKLWNISLAELTPSKDCVQVGTITIRVKPAVSPNIFMSGCTGKGWEPENNYAPNPPRDWY